MSEQTLYTYTEDSLKAAFSMVLILLLTKNYDKSKPGESGADFFDEMMPLVKSIGSIPTERLK